jgi:hypothetical protein
LPNTDWANITEDATDGSRWWPKTKQTRKDQRTDPLERAAKPR